MVDFTFDSASFASLRSFHAFSHSRVHLSFSDASVSHLASADSFSRRKYSITSFPSTSMLSPEALFNWSNKLAFCFSNSAAFASAKRFAASSAPFSLLMAFFAASNSSFFFLSSVLTDSNSAGEIVGVVEVEVASCFFNLSHSTCASENFFCASSNSPKIFVFSAVALVLSSFSFDKLSLTCFNSFSFIAATLFMLSICFCISATADLDASSESPPSCFCTSETFFVISANALETSL